MDTVLVQPQACSETLKYVQAQTYGDNMGMELVVTRVGTTYWRKYENMCWGYKNCNNKL